MRNFLRTWHHSLGYRAGDLLLLAIVWIIVGVGINAGDPDPSHKIPIEYLPDWVRIALWWGPAFIATVAAFYPRRQGGDQYGWSALIIAPAMRAVSYWAAWAQGVLGLGGQASLWPDAVVWTVVTIFVYRLARRPDMPHRPGGGDYGHHPGGAFGHPGLGRRRGER